MSDETERLSLPFLLPAQAQKHVTYNEAMLRLDHLVQLSVKSRQVSAPQEPLVDGDSYIIPEGSTGAWTGRAGELALVVEGVWNFIAPKEGWRAWISDEQGMFLFTEAEGWSALSTGVQGSSDQVERFGINAQADDTNRLSVNADASLFNHAGGGHRMSLNKAEIGETASIVFQSNFSGRAEIGLTGSDALHMRVSENGANFTDAMIMQGDGRVEFPRGLNANLLSGSISGAGGADTVTGPPNLISTASGRRTFSLVVNRVYFSPFYVDRPTRYLGGKVAVSRASNDAGAVMRVGLYHLGEPAGGSWEVGHRLADYGAQDANIAGHKTFMSEDVLTLSPGWYLQAIGVSGGGLEVNAVEWQTPGVLHFIPSGAGMTANFRLGGIARCLSDNVGPSLIENGFPETWQSNPVTDIVSTVFSQLMLAIPFWERQGW